MPERSANAGVLAMTPRDWLGDEELGRLVRAFANLGVTRVRLTGGEPLLLPGVAVNLRHAGLQRITLSLDSLDETVFARMSGGRGSAAATLAGIAAGWGMAHG